MRAGANFDRVAFRFARGRARVRTIVCATHTHEQLDRALLAFEEVGTRLGLIGGRPQA